ncbi:glycosyltransferase [Rhodococcus erythropolis]|uniref:glycosyltransferase n=1 Tax=Rhodococcus erythropolis TaxID=1833 RepID=UPI001E52A281|nr:MULTISPECIES: glycosyltransferase [Rhodococcus erythropolis group]MCD2103675.1 glycosyltransferase [Rhodococcus qingshengii]MCZ4522725.1 glycosyltransferase [Rhodococcus erythropolis]
MNAARPRRELSLISVVVPTFNAVDLIGEQLDALAEQDYDGDFEVLVSDNGSTDGLRSFVESHPLKERLRLKWVDASALKGVSYARNAGVAYARGEFIAFCDADDRVHSSWLRSLAHAAARCDLVSGALETATINSPEVNRWREFIATATPHSYATFLPYAFGCNFGVWKLAYETVGGCDESLPTGGGDDVDFSWRLQLAGMTLVHEMDAIVAYRLRPDLRGTWRQLHNYGVAGAGLHKKYSRLGFARSTPRAVAIEVAVLMLLSPLLPQFVTRMPRGKWITHAGFFVGKLRGSIRYRTFYV